MWRDGAPRAWSAAGIAAAASALLLGLAGACAAADAGPPPAQSGKLAGTISGLLLLALLCYSIYVYAAPLLRNRDRSIVRALAILAVVAIVKILLLPWFDGYANDVASYESWALQMVSEGPARIYRAGYFLDYPPGYLYALWLAGIVANATGAGGVMLRMTVEAPALAADFVLALLMFVFVRRIAPARQTAAYVAMLLVALNPALGFDTIVWGQSDSALTVVIMLSAALALDGEFELAWALAALSVLVKPQALMYVPVLGMWTLLKLPYGRWWRSALAAIAVGAVGVLPSQASHCGCLPSRPRPGAP
jgi:Gpi18-like mannosyltransferase